jgi:hypothetical protein
MPLAAFIAEVMATLRDNPDATELVVEGRVV